jgi:hypothetical protein
VPGNYKHVVLCIYKHIMLCNCKLIMQLALTNPVFGSWTLQELETTEPERGCCQTPTIEARPPPPTVRKCSLAHREDWRQSFPNIYSALIWPDTPVFFFQMELSERAGSLTRQRPYDLTYPQIRSNTVHRSCGLFSPIRGIARFSRAFQGLCQLAGPTGFGQTL